MYLDQISPPQLKIQNRVSLNFLEPNKGLYPKTYQQYYKRNKFHNLLRWQIAIYNILLSHRTTTDITFTEHQSQTATSAVAKFVVPLDLLKTCSEFGLKLFFEIAWH